MTVAQLPRAFPIMAIAGSPVTPTALELAALWSSCVRRQVRAIRIPADPTGLAPAVQGAIEAMPLGLEAGHRRWVFETWDAVLPAMITGHRGGVREIFTIGGIITAGPASVVVVWPGFDPRVRPIAARVGARVVRIEDLAGHHTRRVVGGRHG
jgi:hypothetical protein